MKIKKVSVETAHRQIFEDESTALIVEATRAHPHLTAFVAQIIRTFTAQSALTSRNPNLRQLSAVHQRGRHDRAAAQRICASIEHLYDEFDPGNVRGVLLEAMVQQAIQSRYGGARDLLENNLQIEISAEGKSHTTSTSVDVIGFDGDAEEGECHDCKVRSRDFDKDWLRELLSTVAPFGFRIGIATVDSAAVARRELARLGVHTTASGTLVTPDSLRLLPLLP